LCGVLKRALIPRYLTQVPFSNSLKAISLVQSNRALNGDSTSALLGRKFSDNETAKREKRTWVDSVSIQVRNVNLIC